MNWFLKFIFLLIGTGILLHFNGKFNFFESFIHEKSILPNYATMLYM